MTLVSLTRVSSPCPYGDRKALAGARSTRAPASPTCSGRGALRGRLHRRVLPDVHPGTVALVQALQAGQFAQGLRVDLVGVQPTQLLGQLLAERAAYQRHDP